MNTLQIANTSVEQCTILYPIKWDITLANSSGARAASIAAIAINVVSEPFVAIVNFLLVASIAKNPSLREQERFVAIMYLALVDLFNGLFAQPLFIAKEIYHLTTHEVHCGIDTACYLSIITFSIATFHHLAIVAYDRYVAIINPCRYVDLITVKKLTLWSIFTWICSIGVSFLFIFSTSPPQIRDSIDGIYTLESSIITVLIIASNVKIYLTIRKHEKREAHLQLEQEEDCETRRTRRKERGAAITSAILFSLFAITAVPSAFAAIGLALSGTGIRTPSFFIYLPIYETGILMESLFNAIVIFARNTELKLAVLEMFRLTWNKLERIPDGERRTNRRRRTAENNV